MLTLLNYIFMIITKYENFNWYKRAQEQQTFQFYSEIEPSEPYHTESFNNNPKTKDYLDELLENCSNYIEVVNMLHSSGFNYEEVDFPNDKLISVNVENETYVITDPDYPEAKNAREWIDGLWEHELYSYIPPQEEDDFWTSQDRPSVVYHATTQENVDSILTNGLNPMNKTRGISNRGTPSAIFTSENPDDIGSYGNYIFEINLDQMFNDGYTPSASKETPVEESQIKGQLAWKLGVENYEPQDYSTEGIYDSTIVFYGSIPAKYIKLDY